MEMKVMPSAWPMSYTRQTLGLRNLAGDASLAVKPLEQALVLGGLFGQKLERDGLAQGEIGGAVDFAHAAAAQQPDDAVASAHQSGGEEAAFVDIGGGRDARSRASRGLRHGFGEGRVGAALYQYDSTVVAHVLDMPYLQLWAFYPAAGQFST
jgi:hypothetical protein